MKEKPAYEELEKRVLELENIESEHKHFKEKVREAEVLFKRLYEKAPIGYQSLDENGRFIVVNQAWVDILGYTQEEVIGKSFADFLLPQWRDHFKQNFPRFKAIGEVLGVEFEMVKKDGGSILVSFTGKISRDEKGNFQQTHCIFNDITERRLKERELNNIGWMLTGKPSAKYSEELGYGDLTALNQRGLISRSIDKETLRVISSEYLDLLETSSAIYEKNGDYAFGLFCSGWCRLMDSASRSLCHTENNETALASGKWLCHESCWTDCSKRAIESQLPVDIECNGGIRLYAVPIFCAGEVIGAINFGYGDPPRDAEKLRSLADCYGVDPEELAHEADAYASRPSFVIELAKQRLLSSARLIGIMVERKLAEEALREQRDFSESLVDTAQVIILVLDTQGRIVRFNPYMEKLVGYALDEVKGMDWFETFLSPDIYRAVKPLFQKAVVDIQSSGNVNPILAKDGRTILVEWYNKTLSDKDGNIVGILAIGQDITERKKTEEALLESERQISSIFRSAPIGIGSVVNRVLSKVNNRLCEMTGYDEKDLIGQNARMVYPSDEEFAFVGREKYAQIAAHGTGTVETRWRKKDGTIIDVLLSSTPVNLQDHSKGVTFTALDITERKRAEVALRESEERFKALHNASFGGITIHDQGVILECNQGLSEISGFGYDELIGMNGLLLIAEQSRETVMANIRSGWEKPYEVFGVRKNGEEYPLRLEARKLPYKGAMVRAVEFRDITEHKKAEEALIRQQRIIQLNNQIANVFLTSSQDEVFADVLDVILAALNSRFGFFGYINEAGDLVSPSLTRGVWDQCQMTEKSIVFPRTCWSGLWGRSLMEQQTLIANENLQVPQGHVALENALATPIVFNNTLIGQFVVANKAGGYDKEDRDLLESAAAQTAPILFAFQEEARQQKAQEKLKAQLHQAQKMESVGRLAGGVAHDFNNMLGVILGYTELAMERVEPNDPLHADLKKIQGAAQRSADLTRQLLAFARKQTVSPKVIDLNDTIESILKLLRRLIGEDIDLAWQPGKAVWSVKIDPTQIDQILTNLCVNARDAIVDTGKVTIETGIASLDEDFCSHHAGFVPGDYVLLAVSDTGCGMDEEIQAHLFEPFFTTKEVGKGTGLGLATVYGVVKQNHGYISAYSEPGQGTTFRIYLPRHLDKVVPMPEKGPDKPDERGYETVLVVEDEPAILEMTTSMLERLGYTVLAAGIPGEAIRMAQEYPGRIDLLLTDVVMPEMNGRDLAKNLLSIYPEIRRLFMSGYTSNVIAHHGVLDQGVHFIHKPFSKKDLGEKLREALEG